jgi:hypothetical protein
MCKTSLKEMNRFGKIFKINRIQCMRFYKVQSPNMPTTWSISQAPKEIVTKGPRFEQTVWEYQVDVIDVA